jgi:hypothetical protein
MKKLLQVLLLFLVSGLFCECIAPKPKFVTGHYRLANGEIRAGRLLVVSENELQVRDAQDSVRTYAAAQLRNLVIGPDSFVVLRNFDIIINESLAHYTHSIAQVCAAGKGTELYKVTGPMDVVTKPMDPTTRMILAGIGGGVAGVGREAMAQGMGLVPEARFKEKTVTVYLLRQSPKGELTTLQPGTSLARKTLEAAVADNAILKKKVNQSTMTGLKIEEIISQYISAKS